MNDPRNDQEQPPPELLMAAIGAVIFASDEPVLTEELAAAFGGLDVERAEEIIRSLEECYERDGTGLRVERVAGGVRLATRPEVGAWVRQFFRQRNRTRLSPAALETLAIAAYRQPVTAPEIQAIRGKDPTAALKGLLDKKLIRILGRKRVVGSPLLYGTTRQFLVHFGLNGLGDLPSIEEFDQFLGAIEPSSVLLERPGEPAPGDMLVPGSTPAELDRAPEYDVEGLGGEWPAGPGVEGHG